jgi:hypothetical protein
MNIVKLQRQLQSVPEQALVGYVQNPDGRVPSYLALTELSRRKQMREEYQKAAAPEKSVAESMVEEASGIAAIPQQMGQPMPQQMAPQMPPQLAQAPQPQAPMQMAEGGLAALSLPDDMFDEESYAGGGIVAFDEGGSTTEERRKQAEEDRRLMKRFGYDTLRLPGGVVDILGGGYNALATGADSIANAVGLPRLGRALGIYDPEVSSVALPKVGSGGPTPGQDYINSRINQMYDPQVPATPSAPVTQAQAPFPGPYAPNLDPVAVAEKQAEILRANAQAVDVPATAALRGGKDEAPALRGINYNLPNRLSDVNVPDAVKLNREDFVGEAPTLGGIQALRKDAYNQAGVSEDVYDEMRKDIKDRLKDIPKEREDAVAHAMIMAGLGIAGGTSQFALQNIAQGAMPAVTGFRADVKELNNRRDKLAEREFAVMDAQNKFRQTGADSDLKTLNDREAAYATAKRDYAKTDAQLQDTQVGRKFSLETAIAQEAGQTDRAILSAKLQEQQIGISAFNAKTQRMMATKPEIFTTILSNLESDPEYQKMTGKQKAEYLEQLAASGRAGGAGSKGFTYLKELESEFTNAVSPVYKEYKRIEKAQGLTAADKYRSDWIAGKMAAAGVPQSGTARTSNVIDFNSLP